MTALFAKPIAHRGLHDMNRTRFENTLSAFEAAAQAGYAIECDVVLSADGVPMVFHDLTLDRLTTEAGEVIDRTSAELGKLQIGGTADCIPTLTKALELVAGRVPMIIELKGHDKNEVKLVAAVAKVLADYEGEAAIMSFDHWLVRRFPLDAAGIPAGLTAEGSKASDLEKHFAMLSADLSFVSYNVHHLPNRFVSFCQEKLAMPIITWTVRTPETIAITDTYADQMTFEGFNP
ncbi:MAG: glycerophosphodiester phosphodiesterase [Notoacmeibacter sp.]